MPLMDVSTSKIVQEVKKRPTLWDRSCLSYKIREARSRAWKEVFREVVPDYDNQTASEKKNIERAINQRWKTARDAHIRNRALIKAGASIKKYFYSDQMSFLDRFDLAKDSPSSGIEVEIPASPPAHSRSPTDLLRSPTPPNSAADITDPLNQPSDFQVLEMKQEFVANNSDEDDNNYGNDDGETMFKINDITGNCNNQAKEVPVQAKRWRTIKRKVTTKVNDVKPTNNVNEELVKIINEHSIQMKNDNMAFFVSLLPMVDKFTDMQKLKFRSEVINTVMRIRNQTGNFD